MRTWPHRSRIKRTMDVLLAGIGLLVATPLLVALAVWIRIDSPGPAFFRQTRVGRLGRRFRLWKLRTMVVGSETRSSLTRPGDPRVSRAGRWLRLCKLDELPQLVNVLRGDMSLVGPRPEVPRYVKLYTAGQRPVLDFVPGITDPATLRFHREELLLARAGSPEDFYVTQILPAKIRLSLDYARRASSVSDLAVLLRTAALAVRTVVGIQGSGEPLRHVVRMQQLPQVPEEPRVSVAIATRDRPTALRNCIRSIPQPTYPNIELLILDDNPRKHPAKALHQRFPSAGIRSTRSDRHLGVAGARSAAEYLRAKFGRLWY